MRVRNSPSGPNVALATFGPLVDNGNTGAGAVVNFATGPLQSVTVNANTTLALIGGPPNETCETVLRLAYLGNFTVAFPTARTPGGAPLTLNPGAGFLDLIDCLWDGSAWNLTVRGLAFA